MTTRKTRPHSKAGKGRYKRRPGHIALNNMALAMSGATTLPKQDVQAIISGVAQSAALLKSGAGTEFDWSVLAGHLDMAKAIEHQGKVKGLREHLDEIHTHLYAIRGRAFDGQAWRPTALTFAEADSLDLFISLHELQIESLSRSELRQTLASAKAANLSQGNFVEIRTGVQA